MVGLYYNKKQKRGQNFLPLLKIMKEKNKLKQSGVLMPIFSLPSKFGIGDFGKESFNFIDILSLSGQSFWQILPLVQTGYGNSPYSSICSTSFNPYFISIEKLYEMGLITKKELKSSVCKQKYIDYEFLFRTRYSLLNKAFNRFDINSLDFLRYVQSKESLDYALFMAIKEKDNQKHFYEWEDGLKNREVKALNKFKKENADRVLFWQFVQFIAKKQWFELKKYANKKGVKILGDMPLYVALDSVDVWANKNLFKLDENFAPKKVAGVPPDYFCKDGQLWGNPVYDYAEHQKTGFSWWAERLKKALKVYDYVRIDHFRALDRYYEIDSDKKNAKDGEWVKVPSKKLFNAIHKKVDKTKIIAEDLGLIDEGVRNLLKEVDYPGMKVLSFAFNGDKDNLYLPENIPFNSVCYTGTHDNDTLKGLINGHNQWEKYNFCSGVKNSLTKLGLKRKIDRTESLINAIIELGLKSNAKLFIIPVQDLLKKDSQYRINQPGVVRNQNWAIKFNKSEISIKRFSKLKTLTQKYDRQKD